ncbi:hypothetical protein ACWCQ0_52960, partial [Streptomyces massasporeus]
GFNDAELDVPVRAYASVYPSGMDKAQTALTGIGQFDVTATPLQMAMVSAAIANDGLLAASAPARPTRPCAANSPTGPAAPAPPAWTAKTWPRSSHPY